LGRFAGELLHETHSFFFSKVGKSKTNLLLINKADLLSPELRQKWAAYFRRTGVQFAFFSAQDEADKQRLEEESLLETVVHNRRTKKHAQKRQATYAQPSSLMLEMHRVIV
jgi:ribosome biogenesis GTPase A